MQRTLKRSPSPDGLSGPSQSAGFHRLGRAGWRLSPTALLALGIALGSATPARATFFRINTTFDGTNPQNEQAGATGSAVVTIVAGASLTNGVDAYDYSTVNIYGGTVASVAGEQFGTVNIYGGSIPFDVAILDSSTVNIYGGSIGGALYATYSSTIHLFGCNLRLTPIASMPGGTQYALTGTLQDGTVLNKTVGVSLSGSIQLHQTDTQPPRIDAPPDLTVPADPGQCSASIPFLGIVPVSDNCGTADAIPSTRGPFPLGVTLITWTAIDAAGLTTQASARQKITVTDSEKPTITPPAAVTVDSDPGQSSTSLANVRLGTPQTADNCGVATVGNDAPASFPAGPTTVTWTVMDRAGNSAAATQQVTVKTPTQRFADAIQAAQDQVAALNSAGQLTPALRAALTALLQGIQRALTGRTISGAQLAAARRDVNATITRIQAQLSAPKLPPAQVQLLQGLLSVAQALARALGP